MPSEVVSTIQSGRIILHAKLSWLGSDCCVLVVGGELPHVGAVGWAAIGEPAGSFDLPGHRDSAVVDRFLEILRPHLPGNLVVVAGIHLDNITKPEIQEVLELCRQLAENMVGQVKDPITKKEIK